MSARPNADPCDDETLSEAHGKAGNEAHEVTAPHLFVALECDRPAAGVSRHCLANIDRVTIGRGPARSSDRTFDVRERARVLALTIPDKRLSLRHARLDRVGHLFFVVDLDSRNGTRVNGRVITASTPLEEGDLLQVGHTFLRYRAGLVVPVGEPADVDSSTEDPGCPMGTVDPSFARRVAALGRISRSATPVLVLGETGTGKEVLSRAIHRLSGRTGAFIAVNCGALPASLVEAQLFGHVRGAFSGAVAEARGLVRSADHGTLLLDEIGDLPASAQPALLRVLQEQEVVPLGGTTPIKVDLRVVAATHRPLEGLISQGAFRSDLFARLAGFPFSLPALRDRAEDIGLIVAAFVRDRPLRFTAAAGRALLGYDWPLNVRELLQVLDVAQTLAGDEPIDVPDLPPVVAACATPTRRSRTAPMADPLHQRLIEALRKHEGNVTDVSRELGKARMQVQRWMKRYGIDAASFRR